MNQEKPDFEEGVEKWEGEVRYLERRALITSIDKRLIKQAAEQGENFPESSYYAAMNSLDKKKGWLSLLKKRMKGQPIYDIGCGKEGAYHIAGLRDLFNAGEVALVDPFINEKEISSELAERKIENVRLEVQDGLTFLNSQGIESGNSIINSLDSQVVPVPDYLKRIAQEAFRAAPQGGLLIVSGSEHIRDEAQLLFPYHHDLGIVQIFSKSPLPTHADITREEWRKLGRDPDIEEYTYGIGYYDEALSEDENSFANWKWREDHGSSRQNEEILQLRERTEELQKQLPRADKWAIWKILKRYSDDPEAEIVEYTKEVDRLKKQFPNKHESVINSAIIKSRYGDPPTDKTPEELIEENFLY